MTIDFDEVVERRESGSLKWDLFKAPEGKDILPFWVADMDFRSCPEILAALHERIDHGVFGYTLPTEGVTESVVDYLKREHAVEIQPEWIVWVPGLVPALQMVSRLSGGPGEKLMTNTPVYYPFLTAHRISGMEVTSVPLRNSGSERRPRYEFDFTAMEAAVDESTRLFLLCNPHNPTGRVFDRAELGALFRFCERHRLILCSDEIHCDLVLDPERQAHLTALAFDGPIREQTITLLAASKTYNIAGLANAYAVIPNAKLRAKFLKQLTAHGGFISEPNCLGYHATEAAYRHGEPWRQALLGYLRENRNFLIDYVRKNLPPLHIGDVEATYLAWIDARELGVDSPAALFKSHGVALSDGALFGLPGFARFNFGCRREVMVEGLQRMKKALSTV